jgi:hypothetical protein
MVMRLRDPRMAGIVIHINVIHADWSDLEVLEFLMVIDVFKRNHVNGADQLPVAVIGQKRAGWQSCRIDI